ncbi:MAG TPA: transcriptional repressor LexA [Candidatus Paceibacterota bacterium]|nr:transcriptional repressor LexA [Candidatus Paceibacterota bacterium]
MNFLTKKEKKVLQVINNYFKENGRMPTVRGLKDELNEEGMSIKSVGTVSYYLKRLEDKGFIKRDSSKNRGIKLTSGISNDALVDVPILGVANAGSPTAFADENLEGFLKVSKRILKGKEGAFAIQVEGDSMNKSKVKGKKIKSGDYVVVDPNDKDYKNGDKVLVVVDGLATVKVFKWIDKNRFGLFPDSSNKKHKPIYLTPEDEFIINGKVIDVLKG